MRYLLDTNVCIDVMRGRGDVVHALASLSPDDCAISTVSLFELEAGARKSLHPETELGKVGLFCAVIAALPWTEKAAKESARIRAGLESSGNKIGAYDTLIAGHALALGYTLATDNVNEFSRVAGLEVENWREG